MYLTADAEEELTSLSADEAYVIGGLVDRNRHKNICKDRANALVCPYEPAQLSACGLPLLALRDADQKFAWHVLGFFILVWLAGTSCLLDCMAVSHPLSRWQVVTERLVAGAPLCQAANRAAHRPHRLSYLDGQPCVRNPAGLHAVWQLEGYLCSCYPRAEAWKQS